MGKTVLAADLVSAGDGIRALCRSWLHSRLQFFGRLPFWQSVGIAGICRLNEMRPASTKFGLWVHCRTRRKSIVYSSL